MIPLGIIAGAAVRTGTPPAGDGEHRYWRIKVNANNGGPHFGFTRVEMFTTLAEGNVVPALTGKDSRVAASGIVNSSNAEWMATNLSQSSGWLSSNNSPGEWWRVDLGTPKKVNRVAITGSWNSANSSPSNFEIQWSDDTATWTTALTLTGQGPWSAAGDRRIYDLSPVAPLVSLLHFDGTFADDSGRTWAAGAGASVSSAQSVFGDSSAYFGNIATGKITTTHDGVFHFGHDDFTIEARIRPTGSLGGNPTIYSSRGNGGAAPSLRVNSNGGLLFFAGEGSTSLSTAPGLIELDKWVAVALERYRGAITLYVGGAVAATAPSTSLSMGGPPGRDSFPATIGGRANDAGDSWYGWIDEFRATRGLARYKGAYTPAITPFIYDGG